MKLNNSNETLTFLKPVVRNQMNAKFFEKNYVKLDPVSLTVPDMSYTIKEIIQKFTQGRPVSLKKTEPAYVGQDIQIEQDLLEGVNFDTLDHVEKQEFLTELVERRKAVQERFNKRQEESDQKNSQYQIDQLAKLKAEIKAEIEALERDKAK